MKQNMITLLGLNNKFPINSMLNVVFMALKVRGLTLSKMHAWWSKGSYRKQRSALIDF